MQQLKAIHYLRGVAAIMVCIFHIFSNTGFLLKDLTYIYWLRGGVDIFFVISGFVMVWSTDGRNISPIRFLTQRAQRIVPLYWIATLAVMLQVSGQWSFKIQSLLFIPAMNPKNGMMQPILEPGWTLNYEMFFYTVFAVSLFLKTRHRFLAITSVFILLIMVGQLIEGGPVFEFYTRAIIIEFILGMAIAQFGWKLPSLLVPIGFIAMFLLQTTNLDRVLTLGIPAALIVAGALQTEKHMPEIKLADLLGSASYAIYLFHLLALGTIVEIWPYFDWGDKAFVVIAFGSMLLIGCGIYLALERPIMQYFANQRLRNSGAGSIIKVPVEAVHPQRSQ